MKILYIAPEHVSGTLSLFQAEHARRGDHCRYVTFWHSRWDFPDDICLHLPLMPDRVWVRKIRQGTGMLRGSQPCLNDAGMPYWHPRRPEAALFWVRDQLIWPRIARAIAAFRLDEFDIIHYDGGLDFTRDARFARRLAGSGKHIVAFYHGSDLRTRGVIRALDDCTGLRLTSEWDLLDLDPRLRYLYLPFDTHAYPDRVYRFHSPVRICHAARNPYKGTAFVEDAVRALASKRPVELILLRDLSVRDALTIKKDCDIFVDQLTNEAGWGYGMSSVEALAMGMPVVTNIPPEMEFRIGMHPFVQASPQTITDVLEKLVTREDLCRDLAAQGQAWVRARHDVRVVTEQLYAHYRELGWLHDR